MIKNLLVNSVQAVLSSLKVKYVYKRNINCKLFIAFNKNNSITNRILSGLAKIVAVIVTHVD